MLFEKRGGTLLTATKMATKLPSGNDKDIVGNLPKTEIGPEQWQANTMETMKRHTKLN